ncbi:MAG: PorT family protein [Chitinophagaceae bacterium]|nr:PorT family protein [Chitinophagaceae bacterium]
MRKISILVVLVIFVFVNGKGQTKIALKGGVNYSTARVYHGTEKQPTDYKLGGNIGVQADMPFDGGLHFSPYIAYNLKGFITLPKTGNITKIDNTIHYVEMAPKLTYHFTNDKAGSFTAGAGMSLGVAVAGREKITDNGVTTDEKMKFSIVNKYGLFDFGFVPSIGYSTKKIFIEAVYQMGLTNINNNEENDGRNIRNRTFSLNLGFFLK